MCLRQCVFQILKLLGFERRWLLKSQNPLGSERMYVLKPLEFEGFDCVCVCVCLEIPSLFNF